MIPIGASMLPGTKVTRLYNEIKATLIETVLPSPVIKGYFDAGPGQRNEVITPGGGSRITGNRLRFDEADPAQGIFVINLADDSEAKGHMITTNSNGSLTFNTQPSAELLLANDKIKRNQVQICSMA